MNKRYTTEIVFEDESGREVNLIVKYSVAKARNATLTEPAEEGGPYDIVAEDINGLDYSHYDSHIEEMLCEACLLDMEERLYDYADHLYERQKDRDMGLE